MGEFPVLCLEVLQATSLSKPSGHLTVADLSKTWVIENLDNVVVNLSDSG